MSRRISLNNIYTAVWSIDEEYLVLYYHLFADDFRGVDIVSVGKERA